MNVEPEYSPLGGLVASNKSSGDGLIDALCQLLAQPVGGDALLLWLASNLARSSSQGLVDWLSGFDDIRSHDATLANMIHSLLKIVVDVGNNEHDKTTDMLPSLRAAVHRRIAQKLYYQPQPQQQQQQQPLDPAKNEIRLLRVEPPASDDGGGTGVGSPPFAPSLISCSLVKASLDDDNLHYDALSYVWGDTTKNAIISVAGKVFMVTPNLYTALRDLRSYHLAHRQKRMAAAAAVSAQLSRRGRPPNNVKDRSFLLWVDAICINQQDVTERNRQVALMSRIYERAESVRIYLGPEGPKTGVVFANMARCGGGSVDDRADQPDPPGANIINARGLAEVDSGSLHGLVDLLARPWWTRLWSVQESMLARSGVLHCGNNLAFDFRRLRTILGALTAQTADTTALSMLPSYRILATTGLGRFQRSCALLEVASWRPNQPGPSNFLANPERRVAVPTNLLDAVLHCACTLSHDRIYGILGLLPPELAARIIPDYTAPVERVFEDAALAIFHWAGRLDLLRIAGRGPPKEGSAPNSCLGETLPSWVPEFGNSLDGRFLYRSPAHFRADMGVATCLARRNQPGELTVRGLVFDYVASVTPEPLGFGLPRNMAVLPEILRKRLREWRSTVNTTLTPREFWQTLTTDRIVDPQLGPRRWTELADIGGGVVGHAAAAAAAGASTASADSLSSTWEEWLTTDSRSGVPGGADQDRLVASVWEPHHTANMFVTAARRPGLGDASGASIRVGDVVAVLAGSDEPCILRPISMGVFRFVQTCYCRGAMDGEVLAEMIQRQAGAASKKVVQTMEAAISANYHSITRARFREEKSKAYWSALEKVVNPLFEEIKLV